MRLDSYAIELSTNAEVEVKVKQFARNGFLSNWMFVRDAIVCGPIRFASIVAQNLIRLSRIVSALYLFIYLFLHLLMSICL